ncbi:MAG: HAD-IC family P-type ATPase, partial [Chthonomonadaceae bacterium]|nr:HAD-IC family P-type ATPase [Chthonomonadaceae bacterium]
MPDLIEKKPSPPGFWSVPSSELLTNLRTTPQGLTSDEAQKRFLSGGSGARSRKGKTATLTLFLSQFRSPIILILLFAVILSFFLHDTTNALIILAIILISGSLGFWQERGAANAVEKLLVIIQVEVTLLRDGKPTPVSDEKVVPGDIVLLKAGGLIPGDSLLLDSNSLFVNEATLTGETFPVEKTAGVLASETPLSGRTNSLFTGTYAVSGTGTALVVKTGDDTEFGKVSSSLKQRPPETEFECGIRHFGYLLMEVTLLMTLSIFAINVFLHRPVLDSFLFALALAVGLTPQLLPAIISVNLAHGAKRMAEAKVIVKRLAAIENFGSMDVLCSDKTGTLTLGEVQLNTAVNVDGEQSEKMQLYAQLNAFFQTGYTNPIDAAIVAYRPIEISAYAKLDEEPYDFVRKRLSILVSKGEEHLMVTKGALANILEVCTTSETAAGTLVELETLKIQIQKRFAAFSEQGFRVVGVAYRNLKTQTGLTGDDEKEMTFLGFLALFDPIKPETVETIKTLRKLGISLKLITGDNRLVAAHVGLQAGLRNTNLLTGPDLREMGQEALRKRVGEVEIFAEIEPNQKERLIHALKEAGHVVGYIGDGIN